jgi:shikimate kinase
MKSKIITLVGMSGVGKSHWTKKFKQNGYLTFPIDDLINKNLDEVIDEGSGDKNVDYGKEKVGKLALWMGFPGDARYKKNSKKYLELENEITLDCLHKAIKSKNNCVLDTTGSVVYLNNNLLNELKKHSTIVCLDARQKDIDKMFKIFCAKPKPIIWGNIYKAKPEETENETLKRCYMELLDFRLKKYRAISSITLDYAFTHSKKTNFKKFYSNIFNLN